jgi:hypothetical protein
VFFIRLFRAIICYVGLTTFYKIFLTFNMNVRVFCRILSVMHNTIMAMNNVMFVQEQDLEYLAR